MRKLSLIQNWRIFLYPNELPSSMEYFNSEETSIKQVKWDRTEINQTNEYILSCRIRKGSLITVANHYEASFIHLTDTC